MPPKRPPGLGLAPAFDPDKLKAFDDHDEYHPPAKSAADAEPISVILDKKICIGSVKDLSNLVGLRAMGITHILNVAREVETVPEQKPSPAQQQASPSGGNARAAPEGSSPFEKPSGMRLVASSGGGGSSDVGDDAEGEMNMEESFTATLKGDVSHFQWHHIPLRDGVNKDTAGGIDVAVAYIEQALESGGMVLVHCRRGISRSAAVVVAYVMRHGVDPSRPEHMTYQDSVAFVKGKRHVISLNLEFRVVLETRCEEIRLKREAAQAAAEEAKKKEAAAAAAAATGGGGDGTDIKKRVGNGDKNVAADFA